MAKTPKKPRKNEEDASPLVNAVRHLKKIQRAFLMAYCKCGTITQAAEISGCDRTSHYNWLGDENYRLAFEVADQQATDYLEQEARRRATEGVRRLKFHQGQPIMVQAMTPDGEPIVDERGLPVLVPYVEHEYSDTLLIFLLKAKRPAEFRERYQVEMDATVKSDVVVHVDDLNLPLDTRRQLLDAMRAKDAPPASNGHANGNGKGHNVYNGKPGANGKGH